MGNPRGFWTLCKREVLRYLFRPGQTLLPPVVSVVLFILVFGYVLGPRMAGSTNRGYIIFIFPGLLLMGAATSAFHNASFTLFFSRWDHFIEELLVAPLSYFEMVLAYFLASVLRGILTGLIILGTGFLLLPLPLEHPVLLLIGLAVSSLALTGLGLLTGLCAENWDQMGLLFNFVIAPLMFLGGVFFSTRDLPGGFRWVNEVNPVYYMVSTVRHAILGAADIPYATGFLVTAGLAAVFFVWVLLLFRRGYKLRA